jgi:LCP family protein required for cell wall assembly
VTIIVLLVLVLAWPTSLALWANSKLNHVPALSGAPDTPGTTYLIAGSDARGTGGIVDETTGARADTIMVLNVPPSGRPALMSIPRDTYVQVPGYGGQKINAAYAYGGPSLLVQTVEQLTSLTIDHYVEVGFGSLTDLVDAVGGVNLCWDQTVNDQMSGMVWEAGCHDADGAAALAFSRMRYSDPLGDIGRGQRQRLVIAALAKKAMSPATFLWPPQQIKLVNAGTAAITVDSKTSILDIGKMMLAFRKATGPGGATGVPTIANTGYNVAGVGSTVLLDEAQAAADFAAVKAGTWEGTSPPQQ